MENKYCPRFPFADGANFGDFTLLFCRGRLRNICILRRMCWAVFLSIISFVLSCSRCRRRLGLLKVPGVYIYRTRYNFCDIFPPYTWRGLSAGWKGLTFSCKNVKLGNFFNKIRLRKFLLEVEFLGVWHGWLSWGISYDIMSVKGHEMMKFRWHLKDQQTCHVIMNLQARQTN